MALHLEVGLLDADIYGPSLPSLLPTSVAEKVYGSEGGGVLWVMGDIQMCRLPGPGKQDIRSWTRLKV